MSIPGGWRPGNYTGRRPSHVYTVGLIQARQLGLGESSLHMDLNRFLLMFKARPQWQFCRYNGPGGKVEDKEWPQSCVSREVYEETKGLIDISGLPGPQLFCILHSSTPSDEYSVVYFYHAWADLKAMQEVELRSQEEKWAEPFHIFKLREILAYNTGAILNLRWLAVMAQNILVGGEWATYFEVYERYDKPDADVPKYKAPYRIPEGL